MLALAPPEPPPAAPAAAEGHDEGAGQARDRRVHAGLHPARVLRRRQRRHRARAERRGLGGPRAAFTALLRRAADPRGRRRGGASSSPRDDRGLRGLRQDRHQRRRLRLGDEGLRPHPRRRPGAREFSAKVVDVHELLAARSRRPCASRSSCAPPTTTPATSPTRRASALQPRELLRGIPGLELLEPAEWELCCGSAGIYNLLQPEAAAKLGERKASNLRPPAPRRSPPPTRAARCRSPSTWTSRSTTR